MSRSLYVTSMVVKVPNQRKDNPPRIVSNLPESRAGKVAGGDFLNWIEGVMNNLGDRLTDQKNKNYARVVSVARAPKHPRVLVVELDLGRYGEPGHDIDTDTHQVTHPRTAREAATSRGRVIFVVPEKSDAAMMFAENVGRSSARGRIVDALKQQWMSAGYNQEWILKCESVVEMDAWLEAAELTKVTAVEYNHSSDWQGSPGGKDLGQMTYTLEPRRKTDTLRKELLSALRSSEIPKARALGIEVDDDDLGEVKVTLKRGDVSKTFVVEREKTPSVRLDLTDLESDPSRPNHLISRVIKECPYLYQVVGATWHSV